MPLRAVLWDIDDTLFDHTGSDRTGALRHLRAEGLLARYPSEAAALTHWQSVAREQFARFTAGELGFQEHRRERARRFLGRPLTDDEADGWFARYVACYESAWTLFPDAEPVLTTLAGGYRQGALSNAATAGQDRKLRRLGVRDRFEVLVCCDDLGCAKPAPEAFRAACAALGLPPEEVAYVGDRLDIDAEGARAAGLYGIWLDRTGTAERAAPSPVPGSRPTTGAGGAGSIAGAGPVPGRAATPGAGPAPGAGRRDGTRRPVPRLTRLAELPALLKALPAASPDAP